MKICTKCKLNKTIDNFYIKTKARLYSWCKKCNHIHVLERQRNLKKLAVEYKGSKCQDCLIVDDQCIYDFHHIDKNIKDFTISKYTKTNWSLKLQNELDNCILLCSNCHRKRHIVDLY